MTESLTPENNSEHIPVQEELLLQTFEVKPGLQTAFEDALLHSKGLQRLAYEKAKGWVEEVQMRVSKGAAVEDAACASFPQFFDTNDFGKITRPAKLFIEQYWAGDATSFMAIIDAAVKEKVTPQDRVMGGITDERCKYVDTIDQYRPAPQQTGSKR